MQKKSVAVLGAGLVGSAIAVDLSSDFEVTAVDIDPLSLGKLIASANVKTLQKDLSRNRGLLSAVEGADIVVGALPGSMGFNMIKKLAAEKKDIVDISFFPEDPFLLDELAREHGITVITDCGVAPGMGNIILGYHNKSMVVESYECYVGGLPVVREWPWEYKAVFSPIDVIEEYTRTARYIENGHMIERDALSDPQLMHFKDIGTLEAWNSDGLRTLLKTMTIPNMIEKTLRYPGCIEYLRVLREAGFFSQQAIDIDGIKVRPIDVTARLLFPNWQLKPGEEDFTVMRIIIKGSEMPPGKKGTPLAGEWLTTGRRKTITWSLHDRYDKSTGTISMARTTGYTCAAAVHMIDRGMFSRKGICPPEYLGENEENFNFIMNYLSDRGVDYHKSSEL